nr:MFS transporter [uncultured Pedobacter sp.]
MSNPSKKYKKIKKAHEGIATVLAFALIPLSGFATDVYLPSLPNMAKSLQLNELQVQLTLSFFLMSYGVSQLFIGSFLDSFGRFKISFYSLIILALSCILVANTHNIYLIYFMRVVHGITVSAIVVSKRAYFVDLFEGKKLQHYLSLFTIIWSTGPIVAPFVGGYLEKSFGWESNFYFLAIFAAVFAILEYIFSGETLKHFQEFRIKKIANTYKEMISTTSFTLGIVMLGLAYSMVMVFNMTGPFIIQHHLNLSVVYAGYSSLILGLAWMIGGLIGKSTINRPFFKRLSLNLSVQMFFVALMVASLGFISNIYSLVGFAFLIHICAGFTFNNYFTYCLARFPKNAGISGGLTGGLAYVMVSFLSYFIVEIFPAKDETNLSYSYFLLILGSLLVMLLIYMLDDKKKKESLELINS